MSAVFLKADIVRANGETHETLLAEPLGDDLYELKSIPNLITTLNYDDIVKAVGDPLTITDVVVPSGYQTFRMVFLKGTSKKVHQEVAHSLRRWEATAQLVYEGLYAISVSPDGDIQAVRTYLDELKHRQILLYEPTTPLDQLLLISVENKV
jgi:hypothetical protein